MALNFSAYPMNDDAFEPLPFAFISSPVSQTLALLVELDLVESGSPTARAIWQTGQVTNLLKHARQRSAFWRARLPNGPLPQTILSDLPVFSRSELARQIASEGSLMAGVSEQPELRASATSGSTGTPVQGFITRSNALYNSMRSMLDFFQRGWPVDENQLRLKMFTPEFLADKNLKLKVERSENWIGPLAKLFRSGTYKAISFAQSSEELLAEVRKDRIGYLISGNWQLERLLSGISADEIKSLGAHTWIQFGGPRSPSNAELLKRAGIRSYSNYSCEEAGLLGQECLTCPDYYHVAHSNVIVEEDKTLTTTFDGRRLSRVLVTHLHSFATPLIRYDIGDFAEFLPACPCGHVGTVLTNIYGRRKNFVHHSDGRMTEFYIGTRTAKSICDFNEWRVQQLSYTDILLEISGVNNLSATMIEQFKSLILLGARAEFNVEVRAVDEIDWSNNPKRLFFTCRI
jgi:hypothetical protein